MTPINNTVENTENESFVSNSPQSKHKNRRSLLLLITVFILPILLAKLALENQWLNLGVTNKGQLLEQPLTLAELGIVQQVPDQKWLIIYRLPSVCSEACLHSIEAVHNSYIAIGKDRPRVAAVLLKNNVLSTQQTEQLRKSQWQVVNLNTQIETLLPESQVLITDPLGNVILSHKIPKHSEQQAAFGKEILADMKKLLKYSKVG